MKLVRPIIEGAAGLAALVVAAASASVGCNRNHVDRDGFAERNFDYSNGATDKSGAADPNANGNGDRVGTTTITGASVGALSNDLAILRIVAARCARETACNNVGADKHFVDHDACARNLHAKLSDELDPTECPRGIDAEAVDKCMDSIRSESCNNPIDTISRLAACRTSDMCLRADTTKKR